ncbi:GPI anchored cell wall protein [Aspergillus nomiae NRRL 13137]|uniref:GPI anchored cell wall protein n=1 Tax=Aspergillus nomiae NRRL (strain ATCC 15546 / NRRL 13137 / CBS 260.88 / M93) TaxID=1509407 RepID=A0A0L1IWP9_ASPN3|nr:GPI anchored cell wall protein [Aspergillus nomiae NRRL 13137]KNG83845.1 GPI anchored cell wall protein [Aspergillus nomiae NRRL 13137]
MMLSKVLLSAVFAMTAFALPHHYPRGSPTSIIPTTTSVATSSSASASASASTSGSGSVQIVNNLGSTVYLWSTSDTSSEAQTISSGATYSEAWKTESTGGISIKMATTDSETSVLQFEYTADGDTVYWDLSSINLDSGSEFITAGFSATPNDSSCSSASCSAGDTNCAESYQQPDDTDTNSCSASAGITVTLG